jgi:catechol 2,3-dioxygenase-like lactoylglutathione lyase family enzyme
MQRAASGPPFFFAPNLFENRLLVGSISKRRNSMLKDKTAVANLAVKDIRAARAFYEDVLGFEVVDHEGDLVFAYQSGGSRFLIYKSDFAGTNQATAMTWVVGDEVEKIVGELKARGIRFEHYDMPELEEKNDVYMNDNMKVAWFKDPDGNILNIVSG